MLRLALAALILLACSPAVAGKAVCLSTDYWQDKFAEKAREEHGEVTTLTTKETADYLAVINRQPPQTDWKAGGLLILTSPVRFPLPAFVYGPMTCVLGAVPKEWHEKAMKAARGDDI